MAGRKACGLAVASGRLSSGWWRTGGDAAGFCLRSRLAVDTGSRLLGTRVSRMNVLAVALLVLLGAKEAEALQEQQVCYILDGILFLYGTLLTFLYCRLKFQYRKKTKPPGTSDIYEKVEGIYTGLEVQEMEPYSTIEAPKAPPEGPPPRKTSSEE